MSGTYAWVNTVSSFGFAQHWRRQLIRRAKIGPGCTVLDLMCGMGESWPHIASRHAGLHRLVGVDLSQEMLRFAERRRDRLQGRLAITIRRENALALNLPDVSVDRVICGFGLKTLSAAQQQSLADEIYRVLKPGGRVSLIEISDPVAWRGRGLYMFYLRHVIPLIGRLLLGNPDNYRLLAEYTTRFVDAFSFRRMLERTGLETTGERYFFGCATGVSGYKP